MSSVTNIIITGILDDDDSMLDFRTYMDDYRKNGAAYGDPSQLHVGGDKALETDVFVAAYNYLDKDEFIEYVRTFFKHGTHRYELQSVQIFIQGQHQHRFEVINLEEWQQ